MSESERSEPYRRELEAQILEAARSLVAGSISVTEASRRIAGLARELGLGLEEPFLTFVGIDSETDGFPLGQVRALWNPSALSQLDAERLEYESLLRGVALESAVAVVSRYGPPSS